MIHSRVTIRDIAKQAGLHFTTVALALRNSPRLKLSTRTKIQELAKELGYAPDPMVAALTAYRQTKSQPRYQATIAWINNWPTRDRLRSNPEFREYFEGALERTRERGYVLEDFWLREKGMTPKIANQIFRARNIQGVLIAPQIEAQNLLPFAYDEISAVALGYSMRPAALHVVTNHQFHTLKLILENLQALGYRRAGLCVNEGWDEKVENAWLGGSLVWAWKNYGQLSVSTSSETIEGDALKEWINKEKLDVLIATEDIFQKLKALKFKIPKDIGYADMVLRRDETYFSGAYQNDRMVGRKAIDLIIDMIHRGERGLPAVPVRTLVESTWYPGKTLRPQKLI